MMKTTEDFYCNQKFWYLTVDVEKLSMSSCCEATLERINIDHIKNNPGQIFNSPTLLDERRDMLSNIPVKSCTKACWSPESNVKTSRRISMEGYTRTHLDVESSVSTLNLVLGSDCNLGCVYCCKFYSSFWRNDLLTNGPYGIESGNERFKLTTEDRIVSKLSQKEIKLSSNRKVILKELEHVCGTKGIQRIMITGGEPFLYNDLITLLGELHTTAEIEIWTGLGVDPKRLERQIDMMSHLDISLVISAENVGDHYEFIRNGNNWARLERAVEMFRSKKIKYRFACTLTNMSIFGFSEFLGRFPEESKSLNLCVDPDFMSIGVMDERSKDMVLEQHRNSPVEIKKLIESNIVIEPTLTQRSDIGKFLEEFSSRRGLDLGIFPEHFLDWTRMTTDVVQ